MLVDLLCSTCWKAGAGELLGHFSNPAEERLVPQEANLAPSVIGA
jgi:hypothetical protein